MRKIAIAFAAAITLGLAAPAMAAQDARGPALTVQTDSLLKSAVNSADELSAGKRKWKRHGWRGHRKWRGHRWHGRRHWHRGWGWRHRGWGRCWRVWYHGRRILICR